LAEVLRLRGANAQHWGESVVFGLNNILGLHLVFHDLSEAQARDTFKPFLRFIAGGSTDYTVTSSMNIIAVPARHWWDPAYLAKNMPSIVVHDQRPGEPGANIWYPGGPGTGRLVHPRLGIGVAAR
jgi:hypothetical protein